MAKDKSRGKKPSSKGQMLEEERPQGRLSQSVARGLAILTCFSSEEPVLGIADLADTLGMSRSTTHRYATTLVELGYLNQDNERKYRLGLHVTDLGLSVVKTRHFGHEGVGELTALSKKTGLTAAVAVLDDLDIVYLQYITGASLTPVHEPSRPLSAGSRRPAYRTAAGKVLLAHLPEHELTERVEMTTFEAQGPVSARTRRVFLAELSEIRGAGLAISDEEDEAGVISVAAPVGGNEGEVVAAVSLIASTSQLSVRELLTLHSKILKQTTTKLSATSR